MSVWLAKDLRGENAEYDGEQKPARRQRHEESAHAGAAAEVSACCGVCAPDSGARAVAQNTSVVRSAALSPRRRSTVAAFSACRHARQLRDECASLRRGKELPQSRPNCFWNIAHLCATAPNPALARGIMLAGCEHCLAETLQPNGLSFLNFGTLASRERGYVVKRCCSRARFVGVTLYLLRIRRDHALCADARRSAIQAGRCGSRRDITIETSEACP